MFDLLRPPATYADYRNHVLTLSGLLRKVPFDDRLDVLNEALSRACARWEPARSPWHSWIILILRGEVARSRSSKMTCPLPDDLPGRDETPRIFSNLDLALLFDFLTPRERRALAAKKGGKIAHRARLRLRQLAAQNPKQPRRYCDV